MYQHDGTSQRPTVVRETGIVQPRRSMQRTSNYCIRSTTTIPPSKCVVLIATATSFVYLSASHCDRKSRILVCSVALSETATPSTKTSFQPYHRANYYQIVNKISTFSTRKASNNTLYPTGRIKQPYHCNSFTIYNHQRKHCIY